LHVQHLAVQALVGQQQFADAQQPLPADQRHSVGLRQQRGLVVDIEHAGGVFRPLGVSGHPEQMVSGAAQHDVSLKVLSYPQMRVSMYFL
jgi:hypothetical protein